MTTLDELDSLTSADDADLLLINDVSETTNKGKKITIANLFAKIFAKLMAGLGADLTANHLLSWDGTNSKIADSGIAKGVTVNGHALTENVTVSKTDVGLDSVANTGDSATPSSGGTTKFTTGGAYTLLTQLAPYFSTSTAYSVGNMVTYQGKLYKCTTAHAAGAWNASHFTAKSLKDLISAVVNTGDSATPSSGGTTKFTTGGAYNLLTSLAPIFSTSKAYAMGALCTYSGKLYKCTTAHAAGAWNASHFTAVSLDSCTSNSNALIATSKTITNAPVLTPNQVIKIMFTAALTASNATTALVISYNGVNVTVKAPKDGSLIDYVAKQVGSSYYYCQAYTTLELLYDGTNFVIVGNPVVYSNSDYTIYTDGTNQSKNCIKYLFSGIAAANGIDTGLSVNGGSRGRTYVLIGSAQWDNGNSTASILWLIRCGYNGNNWQVVRIVEEHVSEIFPLNISLTSDGNIFLQSNGGLWYCSIFSNKQ